MKTKTTHEGLLPKLRRETKDEVRRAEERLKALRRFERMINPQARPRRRRTEAR